MRQPPALTDDSAPSDYEAFLADLKHRIQTAQVRATLAVNVELVHLYWTIGRDLVRRQEEQGWGAKIIDKLAADLATAFPGIEGFSRANIYRMRAFYQAWSESSDNRSIVAQPVRQLPAIGTDEFVAQPVRQFGIAPPDHVAAIPWGHNIVLVEKLKSAEERLRYARKTTEHGWSRAVLVHQIETDLHGRQGKAITNFGHTLPSPDSDLVHQLLKDPYNFDFLTLADDADERALERSLIERIRDFLLELGRGFSFIGSQYHLEVSGEDYFLDLFFWHIYLRCYVVIDLKVEDFKPEFAGKMNFYLSAVDDQYRGAHDGPTIGLLLCKSKKQVVVEYALRDATKPIGVASYVVGKPLPPKLRDALPTEAQLRAELEKA